VAKFLPLGVLISCYFAVKFLFSLHFLNTMTSFTKTARLLLLFLGLLTGKSTFAQLVINEYSAANLDQFPDNFQSHDDWIEIYNAGTSTVNLSGYWLSDNATNLQKWKFPATNANIAAGGFVRVWCSDRDTTYVVGSNVHFHSSFKLTQTRNNPEVISLSSPAGALLDQVTVEKTTVDQSRCRSVNGGADWRICTQPTPRASNNGSPQYLAFADRPDIDMDPGFYENSVTVTITTDEPNAQIRYTLDGREPKANSPVYTGPLTITNTTVVKARTFSSNPLILPSFIRFHTYFINEDFSLVTVSIAADTVIELANGDKPLVPRGSIEYFGKDKELKARSYGVINSHGQDSWVNDQRSLDWVSRDEMGYNNALKENIFKYSNRDEYQRIIFRAAGDDNYPATTSPVHDGNCHLRDDYVQTLAKLGGMELDIRASERCVLFLNGQYWGVYSLREKPDDPDYTEYYHNQDEFELQYLKTWGGSWVAYGGLKAYTDWKALRNFILLNDMADPNNYAYVDAQLDFVSMIDYLLVNLNTVASDWMNYNTAWYRGLNPEGGKRKWSYTLWDNDATFDYYINYSGVPNTNPDALPCDLESISAYMNQFFGGGESFYEDPATKEVTMNGNIGRHEKLFYSLMENPDFKQLYYSRSADMMNTVFSCQNMLYVFDSMVAVIQPEMPRHIERWGGDLEEWKANVQAMRDWISVRCTLLDDGLSTCFDLAGPYEVVFNVEPPGAGDIEINTIKIKDFPWTGQYFGNMENLIEADTDFVDKPFLRWISTSGHAIFPDSTAIKARITLTEPDTLIAVFGTVSSSWEPADAYRVQVFPTLASKWLNVSYELPEAQDTRLSIYDAAGRRVAMQALQNSGAGQFSQVLNLDAMNISAGAYLLEFQSGRSRKTVKFSVVR
jgi:hypothetical protein